MAHQMNPSTICFFFLELKGVSCKVEERIQNKKKNSTHWVPKKKKNFNSTKINSEVVKTHKKNY